MSVCTNVSIHGLSFALEQTDRPSDPADSAAWTLWLTPTASRPPDFLPQISSGLSVSGAGCVANDLWDRQFDGRVERTSQRPLARGAISVRNALILLLLMLCLSLGVVLSLDAASRQLCLMLAVAAIPPILLTHRPNDGSTSPGRSRHLLDSPLIPRAAATGEVSADPSLIGCWLATVVWTFGFDSLRRRTDETTPPSVFTAVPSALVDMW